MLDLTKKYTENGVTFNVPDIVEATTRMAQSGTCRTFDEWTAICYLSGYCPNLPVNIAFEIVSELRNRDIIECR